VAAILSHPFRVLPNGAVAVVDQDSPEGEAEQIAVLVLTRLGERTLVPGFGVSDPAFAGLSPTEVVAGVAEYGPPVAIRSVTARVVDATTQAVEIGFE
jgi:hypothetical protein